MPHSPRPRTLLAPELLEDRITPAISFTDFSSNPSIGYFPNGIAAGDLLGNGAMDLAIGNNQDGVEIFTNDGSGNFTQTGVVNPGFAVDFVQLVDMNKDGKVDLVGGGGSAQQIFVALGNGDGTFQAPIIQNVGQNVQSMAIGDLNRDGKPDVVLGIGGGVAILLNNGSANLLGSPTYDYFDHQSELADGGVVIADLNGDGKPDLAVADYTNKGIEIFLNQGNGTFGTPTRYDNPIPQNPATLIAGDFNNDGKLDLVVNYVGTSEVGLLKGNGDGTFQNAVLIDTTAMAVNSGAAMAAADFDGDGNLDLAYATTGGAVILPGDGHGGFGTPIPVNSTFDASGLVAADFNGDGEPDLAVIDSLEPGSYGVALNTSPPLSLSSFNVSVPGKVTVGQPFTVTMTATDTAGGTLASYTGTVDFSSSDGQPVVPSSGQFAASDKGVKQFTVTLGSTGNQSLIVADSSNASATGSATLTVTPRVVDGVKTTASFATSSVASGKTDRITIAVNNASGGAISGLTNNDFAFTLSGGTSTGSFGTVTETATHGVYVVTFTGTSAGTASTLITTVDGIPVASQPKVTVKVGSVSASTSFACFATATAVSGKTDPLTIVVEDAGGNPINGLTNSAFAFKLSGGKTTGTISAVTETKNPGIYVATFTGVLAGTPSTLTIKVKGVQLSDQPVVQVTPGAVSNVKSSVTFATSTVPLGNVDTLTIVVKDAAGNAITGLVSTDFLFTLSGGTSTGEFTPVTETSTPGTYFTWFIGENVGSISTLSLQIDGVLLIKKPTVTVIA